MHGPSLLYVYAHSPIALCMKDPQEVFVGRPIVHVKYVHFIPLVLLPFIQSTVHFLIYS